MSYYDQDTIEEVRRANDIVDVIKEYVPLKKSGSNYFGLCPFHGEKTPSFSVSPSRQMYHCFGCGASGTVYQFMENYLHMSFPEAVEALASRAGITLKKQELTGEQKRKNDRKKTLLAVQKDAAVYFYSLLHSPHGEKCLEYFKKRGLSDETMTKFGLGYSDMYSNDLYQYLKKKGYSDDILRDSGLVTFDERYGVRDKFFNRAMFPVMDQYSKVIAFGGRVMGDGEPKYLNSPETDIFHKSYTLYGLHLARRTRRDYFILCEGYMDVIALHQAGFDCAVASLGTSLTPGQTDIIARITKNVYLSYDSDGAGVKAILRAIPMFRAKGITPRIIHMDPYKDPDEFIKALGADEYQKRIDEAENFFIFEIRQLQKNYDMSDPAARTQFETETAKKLLEFKIELERDNYTDTVCREFSIPVDAMKSLIRRLAVEEMNRPVRINTRPDETVHRPDDVKKKDDPDEMRLLSWIADRPDLFGTVSEYLKPEDFDDGILQNIATQLYDQIEHNGIVSPAVIIDSFDEVDDQNRASWIFHENVRSLQETPKEEKGKAFVITLTKVVKKSYDKRISTLDATDMDRFSLIKEEKESLDKIARLRIADA
ncbi:MAG: DNA primase [Lachnospiraceae bacterium]|nr:DNA primase [Lachnospiraceae bacterium]